MAAIGIGGAMAALLAMLAVLPEPSDMAAYASARAMMLAIANYLFLPSLVLVLISGMFSYAFTPAYLNSGWAFMKLISGVVLFEGGLVAISGPMRREAERAAQALSSGEPLTTASATMGSETFAICVMGSVVIANVALGIWRPRLLSGRATQDDERVDAPKS